LSRDAASALNVVSLVDIAQEFSPRYERHRDDLVSIDVRGLERLLGSPRAIAYELRREAADRGVRVHVAVAGTRMAALVLALVRPGVTVVDRGEEAVALAPVPIGVLERVLEQTDDHDDQPQSSQSSQRNLGQKSSASSSSAPRQARGIPSLPRDAVSVLQQWGIRTLGELAALPAADLAARLGPQGLVCQAVARGEDLGPLVPTLADERFESSIELEWPIEGFEPLSFVLTRLLEPISTRLERRDCGAAVLHVFLRLVTGDQHARRLELPAPLRDVRTLRALALIDLESHPPPAAIDAVTVVIDPTPGRVLQHTLFARGSTGSPRPERVEGRAHPTPDALSTLLARLGALVGQDRIGAPATVDSYRPGAFAMKPFAIDHDLDNHRRDRRARRESFVEDSAISASSAVNVVAALRRCRQPVPARVVVAGGRPVRVTTDRPSYAGGAVLASAGPWRTSGNWWKQSSVASRQSVVGVRNQSAVDGRPATVGAELSTGNGRLSTAWDRDEWDVALADEAVYRIFHDRETDGWCIDAIVD